MFFVKIDECQLHTRLVNCGECGSDRQSLADWLDERGFVPARGDGWYADSEGMNCLSCSEILFSEFTPTICYADGRCVPVNLWQATSLQMAR